MHAPRTLPKGSIWTATYAETRLRISSFGVGPKVVLRLLQAPLRRPPLVPLVGCPGCPGCPQRLNLAGGWWCNGREKTCLASCEHPKIRGYHGINHNISESTNGSRWPLVAFDHVAGRHCWKSWLVGGWNRTALSVLQACDLLRGQWDYIV